MQRRLCLRHFHSLQVEKKARIKDGDSFPACLRLDMGAVARPAARPYTCMGG